MRPWVLGFSRPPANLCSMRVLGPSPVGSQSNRTLANQTQYYSNAVQTAQPRSVEGAGSIVLRTLHALKGIILSLTYRLWILILPWRLFGFFVMRKCTVVRWSVACARVCLKEEICDHPDSDHLEAANFAKPKRRRIHLGCDFTTDKKRGNSIPPCLLGPFNFAVGG